MKWDGCQSRFGEDGLLPFWVADMDFAAPACVRRALADFSEFGVFGYYEPGPGYADSFIAWERDRHGYEVDRSWIRYAPGVVPAINWWLHILTREGDAVCIMPPVYYPFHDAVVNNARTLVECPLLREAEGYRMDVAGFERLVAERDVKVFILCSPHNPAGRVWERDELTKVLAVCAVHGVYVISDEIHQDIVMPGHRHIPSATVDGCGGRLVTLTAASKTFNLAACQNSFVVVEDEGLRRRWDDYLIRLRLKGGNPFGYIAVQAAYEGGAAWLDELVRIVHGNYLFLRGALEEALPEVWVPELQGTYLMWIDLGAYVAPDDMERILQESCGMAVDYGSWFGGAGSGRFIRINLATSRQNIETAAARLIAALGA